jgi:hypothetical protein
MPDTRMGAGFYQCSQLLETLRRCGFEEEEKERVLRVRGDFCLRALRSVLNTCIHCDYSSHVQTLMKCSLSHLNRDSLASLCCVWL